MPIISGNLGGPDGPLASLEFNTKYDTTFFPSDLADTPYFIIFRAQKEFKFSPLASVKPKYSRTSTQRLGSSGDRDGSDAESEILDDRRLVRTPSNLLRAGIQQVVKLGKTVGINNINISQPAHSFALPIPSNLSTSYNAQYNSQQELGALGVKAREVAANMSGGSGVLTEDLVSALKNTNFSASELKGVLGNLAIGAVESGAGTAALAALLGNLGPAGAAAAAALSTVGTGALVGLGLARNPHIANVFTGVNFRTHQFEYKLIAKNKKESDTIRDLIRNFKFHMAPDYNGSSHIFTYPSKFQIILKAGDYLFKIGDSVLTEFTVNYNGEGAPYFFEDTNAPYSVTISMSFVENTIVTKKEIREGR